MRIYEFEIVEGQEWALPVDDRDFEVFRGFDGTPRREGWEPVRVYLLKETENHLCEYSDFRWLHQHVPVLKRRAVDAVGEVLSKYGELLPLSCDEAELVAFNACRVIDALDLEGTQVVRFPDSERIMRVESYAFKAETLQGVQVFKVPQLLLGPLFIDQTVVDLVHQARLER